jgi:PAS domain S-box-containing protein
MKNAFKRNWQHLFFPLFVFLVILIVTLDVYKIQYQDELENIKILSYQNADKVRALLTIQLKGNIQTLSRLQRRWEKSNGTPFLQWEDDVMNYTNDIAGLTYVGWEDTNRDLRWLYPKKNIEGMLDAAIGTKQYKETVLKNNQKNPVLLPPQAKIDGYQPLVVYIPIYIGTKFDGFIVAVFSIPDLMKSVISKSTNEDFIISLILNNNILFVNNLQNLEVGKSFGIEIDFLIFEKNWKLILIPTAEFFANELSPLPMYVLIFGILIAFLSALLFYLYKIALTKASQLQISQNLTIADTVRINTILNTISDGVLTMDEFWVILSVNQRGALILGYTESELIGKNIQVIFKKDPKAPKQDDFFDLDNSNRNKNENGCREVIAERKDGSEISVELVLEKIKAGESEKFVGTYRDISERKKIEEDLKLSEATFRLAIENAPIGEALINPNWEAIKVNNALCKIMKSSNEELLKQGFRSFVHEEDFESLISNLEKIIKDTNKNLNLEIRLYDKNGNVIWTLMSVSLVRNGDQTPNYFIFQIQDISETKEVERIKKEFISTVSHELRTPLTSIRGSLGLIKANLKGDTSEMSRKLIDIAHSNSERLILLINDILDIDKMASGNMRFNMEDKQIAALTKEAIDATEAYAAKYNTTIELTEIDDSIVVRVAVDRYIQALMNLLSNAAKFSPSGGKIRVFSEIIGNNVRISVSDDGPGIQEEYKKRIFSKFSQSDSSSTRLKGGTGLGLYITRQIVEHMNGQIGFDSEVNKGTTFWCEFPVVLSSTEDKKIISKDKNMLSNEELFVKLEKFINSNQGAKAPRLRNDLPRILHIEDDSELSEFILAALPGKVNFFAVTSLSQANQMIEQDQFDLIIIDIHLPDGCGLDILDTLAEKQPNSKKMILTAIDVSPIVDLNTSSILIKSRISEVEMIEKIKRLLFDEVYEKKSHQ